MSWYRRLYDALLRCYACKGLPPEATSVVVELPTLYVTPTPPVGIEESRDLAHANDELVRRYHLVKDEYQQTTGNSLFETCTWRSVKRQGELYAQGRTTKGKKVTFIDGVTMKSRHNVFPSEAIDVAVDIDPTPKRFVEWAPEAYALLGPLCEKHGLIWGGTFKTLRDYPHIELPAKESKA